MELRLLRETKIFHGRYEGIKIPFMKIGMQFQRERRLDIVLGLKMHLSPFFSVREEDKIYKLTLTSWCTYLM